MITSLTSLTPYSLTYPYAEDEGRGVLIAVKRINQGLPDGVFVSGLAMVGILSDGEGKRLLVKFREDIAVVSPSDDISGIVVPEAQAVGGAIILS